MNPANGPIRVAVVLAALLIIAIAGVAIARESPTSAHAQRPLWFTGTTWQPSPLVRRAPNFTIPDQNRSISLRGLRGRVTLLSFASSVCKRQCPLVGRSLGTVERMLGPLSRRRDLVSISVDPLSDTSASVRRVAAKAGWERYHWYYLWSSLARMEPIWKSYYIYVGSQPNTASNADVKRLAAVVLIDQESRIRAYTAWPVLPAQLASGVRDLLVGHT
jgi:cytochrome oxidase Cu insertion factor (SCO1/SenC/PrrC family)